MAALLGYGSIALFGATAVVSLRRWRVEGSRTSMWAALAFLALVIVQGSSLLTDALGATSADWLVKVTIGLLALFPYFLFRFAGSLSSFTPAVERAGAFLTGAVLVVTAVLPPFPADDQTRPAWLLAFFLLFLVQWTALTLWTIRAIWKPSFELPAVARRRIRSLAYAAIGINFAILIAFAAPTGILENAVSVLGLLSAAAFYLSMSPPPFIRDVWRRPEQRNLQAAVMELMEAHTREEVAQVLLPRAAGSVGARSARLVDNEGDIVGSFGGTPAEDSIERIELGREVGVLEIETSRFTPYFGPEELVLLRSIGTLAGLAMERAEMLKNEQLAKATLESFNKQLQGRNEELSREVTERRRAEQELVLAREEADRANLAKSEFLSRMSHELRTPLNSILGFGQLLELDELSSEQQEGVSHILKAGKHLLDLINEILDISRIEAGNMTLSMEPIPVNDAVDEAVSLIRPIAHRRGITLSVSPATNGNAHVLADRQRLKQVMLNLLGNAVKYNRQGGNVAISAEENASSLRICVKDEGFGISEKKMEKLFEPFDRLGAETSAVEGTGLGLALSKGLVELMGGRIGVESVPEEGSTFWLDFQIAAAPVDILDAPVLNNGNVTAKTATRTILYIEDNLSNLKLIEHLLGRRGDVRLLTAMQAKLGLELAREHEPDIILLDLHLPDMSGEEALRELRHDPLTRGICVVVVSADATPGQIKRILDNGADAYLTKPLDIKRFHSVLDEQIGGLVA
jgi:signal transduction histidine kinase/ActR/RegA family two-component response regulator